MRASIGHRPAAAGTNEEVQLTAVLDSFARRCLISFPCWIPMHGRVGGTAGIHNGRREHGDGDAGALVLPRVVLDPNRTTRSSVL